jgi:hypothetical protein
VRQEQALRDIGQRRQGRRKPGGRACRQEKSLPRGHPQ